MAEDDEEEQTGGPLVVVAEEKGPEEVAGDSTAAEGDDRKEGGVERNGTAVSKPGSDSNSTQQEAIVQLLLEAIEHDIDVAQGMEEEEEDAAEAPEKPVVACRMDSRPGERVSRRNVNLANMRKWAEQATLSFTAITNRRKPASDALASVAGVQAARPHPSRAASSSSSARGLAVDVPGGGWGSGGHPRAGSSVPAGAAASAVAAQGGDQGASPVQATAVAAASGADRGAGDASRGRAPAPAGGAAGTSGGGAGSAAGQRGFGGVRARQALDGEFEGVLDMLAPWRSLVSPQVYGEQHLPLDALGHRPVLFVGNHTLFGLYDMPLLMLELYLRGIKARGLAHPLHWRGPLGAVFERFGAVQVSPRAFYKLLQDNQAVLLFPGGGREVNKRRGEKYRLFWREQVDFVRMASRCKAIIVPFAAVGGDDAYDLVMDTEDILSHPLLGPLARRVASSLAPGLPAEELVMPLAKLPGTNLPAPLPLPNLERLYFKFMPAIDTAVLGTNVRDAAACEALYQQVQASVEQGMQDLQLEQEADPLRGVRARLAHQAAQMMPAFDLLGWSRQQ